MATHIPVLYNCVGISLILITALISAADGQSGKELHPQNGFFNNLFEPDWGATGNELLRSTFPVYSDQVYEVGGENRPNPLSISTAVHSGTSGKGSNSGRNAMLVFFGQLVVDEIVDSRRQGCPPEYANIPIPQGHPYRDKAQDMVFKRSVYNQRTGVSPNYPRQQQNNVTPYLDGGFLYGTTRFWTNSIREFKGGRLKRSLDNPNYPALNDQRLPLANPPVPRDHSLREASRFFRMGNTRGHENPFLLALQIVWFRWHNFVAQRLSDAHAGWDDERLFQETRRLVTAHFQKIVFKDWLPHYLGSVPDEYKGYNPRVHPGITQEFALAAMKFGHTLVPAGVWTVNENSTVRTKDLGPDGEERNVDAIRLCNTFWNAQQLVEDNFYAIVQGMTYTLSKSEDQNYVSDLREYLYGPYEFSRQDLAALDVQRSRDHGMASYNTVREAFNLSRKESWREIGNGKFSMFQRVYGDSSSPDDLDLITGGLLESGGQGPGELFSRILLDQFQRIRDADRFWYENRLNRLFTEREIQEIETVTFHKILSATTGLHTDSVSQDAFLCTDRRRCQQPPNMDDPNDTRFGVCTKLQTFDFFTGSEVSFVLSLLLLGLSVPASIGVLMLVVWQRKRTTSVINRRNSRRRRKGKKDKFTASEWLGPESGERNVTVEFDSQRKKIKVTDFCGRDLRFIDLRMTYKVNLRLSNDKHLNLLSIRIPGEVDLILRFPNLGDRGEFLQCLEQFMKTIDTQSEKQEQPEHMIIRHSNNRDDRQKLLDKFFRVVCLKALKKDQTDTDYTDPELEVANDVIKLRLTRTEFAESLGIQASSSFVRNVFLLADTNNDGFLSFKEFLDLFAVFATGTAEDKARMLFNIYDIRRRGYLTRDDFFKMILSLLDLSDASLDNTHVTDLMEVMFRDAGIADKEKMNFEEFKKVFLSKEYESTLQAASIAGEDTAVSRHSKKVNDPQKRRSSLVQTYRLFRDKIAGDQKARTKKSQLRPSVDKRQYPGTPLAQKWFAFSRYVQTYQRHIFWTTLYTLVCVGMFGETAYYYAVGREHAGLRRLSGAWTTAMIRGSASVIMFNLATLLVTMCRNTITRLRETFVHRFVPFDSAVTFHKYIAVMLMIASIIHIVGHCINLYCMSTQPAQDLSCLFREFFRPLTKVVARRSLWNRVSLGFISSEMFTTVVNQWKVTALITSHTEISSWNGHLLHFVVFFRSHVLYTFHFWAFQTMTGLAGAAVTVVMFIMYVFATQFARRNVFTFFWLTHSFYSLAYFLIFLHGIGRLVQDPKFPWYMIGPLILYVVDKLQTVSRNKVEISVRKAELLPSGVTELVVKRPASFVYKSGQWVRIACLDLGKSEYHPFTLTSAPHEENLSLHIRAVGPWTTNLRKTYDPYNLGMKPYPKLYLDGPFGEGHQDWYTFDVAVLVGGGIGVTPFASILKDVTYKSQTGDRFTCKKVYFVWVTRTQKHYEWLVDVIRDVENKDRHNLVSVHIFITQFQQKFDLRTTMLYICERHFQKVESRSLFTGLRAITHFGRPRFEDFLGSLHQEHPQVTRIGVFSCGPGPLTGAVQAACSYLNTVKGPSFSHHFENF